MARLFIPLIMIPLLTHAEEPKSKLEIAPQDILSTRVRHDGKRGITFEKLDPITMDRKASLLKPLPHPKTAPSAPIEISPSDKKSIEQLTIGASVHIDDPARPDKAITELTLWSPGGQTAVAKLWVNANFLWLTSALHEFQTETTRYSLMLIASHGSGEIPENLPFPADGKPTLVVGAGNPTEAQLAPLDELLRIYTRDQAQLRQSFEQRKQQAAIAEAERLANPPEKKNIRIRYWVKPQGAAVEGGQR